MSTKGGVPAHSNSAAAVSAPCEAFDEVAIQRTCTCIKHRPQSALSLVIWPVQSVNVSARRNHPESAGNELGEARGSLHTGSLEPDSEHGIPEQQRGTRVEEHGQSPQAKERSRPRDPQQELNLARSACVSYEH